jgi:hypothetical protein
MLKAILNGKDYSLYHWSPLSAATNIIREKYLFSKATLFSMYYPNLALLTHIKRSNALAEAQHGFTDYIFLGNTNWVAEGSTSHYGDVCFVIKPEKVLPFREFFVFPFNTGRYWSFTDEAQHVSDLGMLIQALECKHPCFEILVRRRIKISSSCIKEIICDSSMVPKIENELHVNSIPGILVKPHEVHQLTNNNQRYDFNAIEIMDPFDEGKNFFTYQRGEFIQKDKMIYVRTEFSSCILEAKIVDGGKLVDPFTHEEIGRIKHDVACFLGNR